MYRPRDSRFSALQFLDFTFSDLPQNLEDAAFRAQLFTPVLTLAEIADADHQTSLPDFSFVSNPNAAVGVESDDYAGDSSTTGVLVLDGGNVSGTIDFDDDLDWFRLELTSTEQLIAIDILSVLGGSFNDLRLSIFDAAETQIHRDVSVNRNRPAIFEFESAGTYFVQVGSRQSNMDYSVNAATVFDDFEDDTSTTGIVEIDGSNVSGAIDYWQDLDWFRVETSTSDQVVAFSPVALTDQTYINFTVFDGNGDFLAGYPRSEINELAYHAFGEAGTYFVELSNSGALSGYTFRAIEIADDFAASHRTTGVIEIDGGPVSGQADYIRDADWFGIEIDTPGLTIKLNIVELIDLDSVRVRIYDSSDNVLSNFNYMDTSDELIFEFADADTYFIEAYGYLDVGNYAIEVQSLPDDFSDDPFTSGVVELDGTDISGQIDFAGDRDWFRLDVSDVQQIFSINITETVGLSRLYAGIYDSAGNSTYASDILEVGESLRFQLDDIGTYFVEIDGLSSIGQYAFNADFRYDDFAGDSLTTGVLNLDGDDVNGSIEVRGDSDWFKLDIANANQIVGLNLLSLTPDEYVDFTIYDEDENYVTTLRTVEAGETFYFEFDTDGVYFIEVFSSLFFSDYVISADSITDDYSQDIFTTAQVVLGGSDAVGNIDYIGDRDWFRLEVDTSGQLVAFSPTFLTGLPYINFSIFDGNGNRLDSETGFRIDDLYYFEFSEAGTYFVELFGGDIRDYAFNAIAIDDDYAGDSSTTGIATLDGGITTGSWDYPEDTDWFRFTISENNQVIRVTVQTLSGPEELNFGLFDISENWLDGQGSLSDGEQFTYQFADAGTYFLEVSGRYDFGEYGFNIDLIVDDFTSDNTTAGRLEVGAAAQTGRIDFAADRDWFAVDVSHDRQIVALVLESLTGLYYVDLSIIDSNGVVLAYQYSAYAEDLFVYEFDVAGTYFIEVEGQSQQVGEYAISLNEIIDDYTDDTTTAGEITLDGPAVSGEIHFDGDADWFELDISGPETIIGLSFTNINNINSVGLEIFDAAGNSLTSDSYVQSGESIFYEFDTAGTYFVSAEGDLRNTDGNEYQLTAYTINDDYADDVTTTGVLTLDGQLVSGRIDYLTDSDWFKFSVVHASDVVRIRPMNFTDLYDVSMTVYDANGNFLLYEYRVNGEEALFFEPGAVGDYFVAIGQEDYLGEYQLSAQVITDDYSADDTTSGIVPTDGSEFSGEIERPGDSDWFALEVAAPGDAYSFELTELSNLDSVILRIISENGSQIFARSFNGIGSIAFFDIPDDGTFFLSVQNTSSFGTYAFKVTEILDDFAGDTSTTGELPTDGSNISGQIEKPSDDDWLKVEIDSPDTIIRFTVTELIGLGDVSLTLFDSAGNFVNSATVLDQGELLFFEFLSPGNFFLSVRSPFGDIGDYSLSASLVIDDYAGDTTTTGEIVVGGTPVSGSIDYDADQDWFAIDISSANEVIRLSLEPTSVLNSVRLSIYDSSGTLILSNITAFQTNDVFAEFAAAGEYFVSVERDGAYGDYKISAQIQGDDFASNVTTSGVVNLDGAAVSGNTDFIEDDDWFRLEIDEAGQIVSFVVTSDVTGYDPSRLRVYDANGNVLEDWQILFEEEYPKNFNFETAGTYFVGFENSSLGAYSIELTSVIDDYAGNVTTTGVAALDSGPVSGTIDYEGDADWFRVDVANDGEQISFIFDRVSGLDLDVALYDNAGNLISSDSIYEFSNGFLDTLDFSGTYFLSVEAGNDNVPIDYSFEARIVSDDFAADASTAGQLPLDGTAITASIDFAYDDDWFAFEVTDLSKAHVVTLDWTGSYHPNLRVYDQNGSFVDFLASGNVIDLSSTGTYYLAVEGGQTVGDYGISVEAITDDYAGDMSTTGTLDLETRTEGLIQYRDDLDWFQIDVESGYYALNFQADIFEAPYDISIYDATGNYLGGRSLTYFGESNFDFYIPSDGEYFVEIDGPVGASYSLGLAETDAPSVLDSIRWGTVIDGADDPGTLTINYFFQQAAANALDNVTTLDWTAYEMAQMRAALDVIETMIDVEFVEAATIEDAYFKFGVVNYSGSGYSAYAYPPSYTEFAGVSVYNRASTVFDEAGQTWDEGGLGFEVLLHELGHALGLAHPHDEGGDSVIMDGVFSPYSYGLFDLNQGVFTVMSYNSGWLTSPNGSPVDYSSGWMRSFAPFDIAVLQSLYGANDSTGAGDSIYILPTGSGGDLEAIWDTGGIDLIAATPNASAYIDLRAASLAYEIGGGGFVSYSDGLPGGFVIANGVDIENASGSLVDDTLIGNALDNTLGGFDGDDEIFGGDGNDRLIGGRGADVLDGGDGVDMASYADSFNGVAVNLTSGTGIAGTASGDVLLNIEMLFGSIFDDRLTGDNNANVLLGHDGDDLLFGRAGDDILIGGLGADALDGGDGIDTADYSGSFSAVAVNLGSGVGIAGTAGGDTLVNIENVTGSDFNDNLVGDLDENMLIGGDGDDSLRGLSGDDILVGGLGADTLDGGGGEDTADYSGSSGGVVVNLRAGIGIAADAAGDVLIGMDNIIGSDFDDVLTGGNGPNDLFGGAGADELRGFSGRDELYGGTGDDLLDGTGGADFLYGGSGHDTLLGGNGRDELFGGDGDDILDGQLGRDFFTGGAGSDTFVMGANFGIARILDFEDGVDVIDFSGSSLANDFADISAALSRAGPNVRIELGGGYSVVIENVDMTDIDAADFVF